MPLVSIIMPAFNSEATIEKSVNSVIGQTFTDWELIICDDSSIDNTTSIIKTFKDKRIKVVSNEFMKGACGARNSAIRKSKGRFIAFLDSDDVWFPYKIEYQLKFMVEENCLFTFGEYFVGVDEKSDNNRVFSPQENISFSDLLSTCGIGCLTVMLDTKGINRECISFPEVPKEDYALWLYLTKKFNIVARRYPGLLAFYRIGGSSLSSNKFKEIPKQYAVLRKYGDLSVTMSFYYLVKYMFLGLVKHGFFYRFK